MTNIFELPVGRLETMAFAGDKGEFLLYGQCRYGPALRAVVTGVATSKEELRSIIDRKTQEARKRGEVVIDDQALL